MNIFTTVTSALFDGEDRVGMMRGQDSPADLVWTNMRLVGRPGMGGVCPYATTHPNPRGDMAQWWVASMVHEVRVYRPGKARNAG